MNVRFGEVAMMTPFRVMTTGLVAMVLCGVLWGDEPVDEEKRAAHLARTKALAERFEVRVTAGGPKSKLSAQPVLRYNDSTRRQDDSTLWIWTERERPVALLAIEYYPKRPSDSQWLYELVSLSPHRITASRGPAWSWQGQTGLVRTPLEGAPVPADQPARRLAQSRQLRNRFTASETAVIEGRLELRPMAAPIYRYADAETGVQDGVIFAFANGTNPEVLLIMEAHSATEKVPARWVYALAQATGGEVHVDLDGKELWKQTEAEPPAVRPAYANGWMSGD